MSIYRVWIQVEEETEEGDLINHDEPDYIGPYDTLEEAKKAANQVGESSTANEGE